jgi:serine/threonine-protein kinase
MSQDIQNIGRYQVLSILGQGAMGKVFLAQDPLLKRKVAIKVVRERGQEATHLAMERFQREAEISARLNHPNIITVYDVGVDDQVGPFLAMEFVEGMSLARVIRERQADREALLKLLVQGAQALHAAGAAGIVHRDVKPENMLVSVDGRLKLMDFGIANQADQTRLTALGTVVGTPSYTAPEILMGGEPSAASDRYAFAVTAFECFTGQVPFVGDTVGATLLKIVHEPPVLPPDLGPDLSEVFEIALAKDPATRYPDLFTLLDALIEASPVPAGTKAKLQAALEGEGTLSGLGSGPMTLPGLGSTHPGSSATNPGDQATVAIRTTPIPAPPAPPAEDPLAFLGALESQASEVAHPPVPPAPREELLSTGPIKVPVVIPESRTPAPTAAPPGRRRGLGLASLALLLVVGGGLGAWAYQRQQRRKPRLLKVETDPPGAEVLVDGVPLAGTTPLVKEIPGTTHRLELRLKGFKPLPMDLPEGPLNLRPFALEPLPPALTLATDPPGVRVTIDGEEVGITPLDAKPVPAHLLKGKGTRPKLILRLEKEGFVPQVQSFESGKELGLITLQPEAPVRKR